MNEKQKATTVTHIWNSSSSYSRNFLRFLLSRASHNPNLLLNAMLAFVWWSLRALFPQHLRPIILSNSESYSYSSPILSIVPHNENTDVKASIKLYKGIGISNYICKWLILRKQKITEFTINQKWNWPFFLSSYFINLFFPFNPDLEFVCLYNQSEHLLFFLNLKLF